MHWLLLSILVVILSAILTPWVIVNLIAIRNAMADLMEAEFTNEMLLVFWAGTCLGLLLGLLI